MKCKRYSGGRSARTAEREQTPSQNNAYACQRMPAGLMAVGWVRLRKTAQLPTQRLETTITRSRQTLAASRPVTGHRVELQHVLSVREDATDGNSHINCESRAGIACAHGKAGRLGYRCSPCRRKGCMAIV